MSKAAKRARKKEGRQARLEAAKKAAERRRRRNLNVFLGALVVAAVGIFAITQLTHKTKKTSTTPAPCTTAKPPLGSTVSQTTAPLMAISPTSTYTATIATSCGTIVVDLDAKDSPNTVNSFVYLANKGFYNGLNFHRVAKDFAIQGGDPSGTGNGGPGYTVQDAVPAGVSYTVGTVAMAKTGAEPAGTAGSQFFIVPSASAAANFTPDYAILGHVTSGEDVVTKMNALAPSSRDGPPTQPIYIDTITIKSS